MLKYAVEMLRSRIHGSVNFYDAVINVNLPRVITKGSSKTQRHHTSNGKSNILLPAIMLLTIQILEYSLIASSNVLIELIETPSS